MCISGLDVITGKLVRAQAHTGHTVTRNVFGTFGEILTVVFCAISGYTTIGEYCEVWRTV